MTGYERGRREYRELFGGEPEQDLAEIRRRSPDLFDTMIEVGFGRSFARPELTRADRELATVAMLAALGGCEPQLAIHVRGALRQGWSPTELRALCEHAALYVGFPRALNALAAIDAAMLAEGASQPAQLCRVTVSDHDTVVAQCGDAGPPVMLIHSLGMDWRMWEPVMAGLAAGRRIFAYDVRGHGQAAGAPREFTMTDTASDLIRVLDALGLDRVHVVGLSLGGAIAQSFAVDYPERTASLALLATVDEPIPDGFEARAQSAETDGMAAQVSLALTHWFTPEALAENGWGVRYTRERVLRSDPADWAAIWRAYKSLDVRGRLRSFDAPVLVLAGERDASVSPAAMKRLADGIVATGGNVIYEILPGAPHMQSLECPDLVVKALDRFLPTQ